MSNYIVDGSDLTSVANAIRAKSGGSSQLAFPVGFVSAIGSIPVSSEASVITVASGTFIGQNNTDSTVGAGRQKFVVGKKMPQTDFYLRINAKDGEEYPYDTSYKIVNANFGAFHEWGYYDLSTNGTKTITPTAYSVDINNSGTISSISAGMYFGWLYTVRNGAIGGGNAANKFEITKDSTGFAVLVGISNSVYKFSAIEYEWKLVYFGSNPSTDIVEVP